MFLFLRLLTAHFISDFLLQTHVIFIQKKKGLWGACAHYLITFLVLLIFALPYIRYRGLWAVLFLALLTHIILDEIKLRLTWPARFKLPIFILDQFFHILFIAPIIFFGFSRVAPAGDSFILLLYKNNLLFLLLVSYIVSVFLGGHLWAAFKGEEGVKPYGLLMRFIITTAYLGRYLWPLLLIPIFLRKSILAEVKFDKSYLVFNYLFSSFIGILLIVMRSSHYFK
jgi:hypothetical protein